MRAGHNWPTRPTLGARPNGLGRDLRLRRSAGLPQLVEHCLLLEDVDCSRDHESQDDE